MTNGAKALLCVGGLCACLGSAQAQESWMLVQIPDTQFYSETAARAPQFSSQTQWIVNNLAQRRIRFVSHIGDVVQNGSNATEWSRAVAAMNILEGGNPANAALVPYAVAPGNHDYLITGLKSSGTTQYNANFGPARYAGEPWYLGASSNQRNHAQRFAAGGRTYLNLTLDWQPTTADFTWAQGIINANLGLPTILTTHEHIQDADGSGNGAGRSGPGQFTWDSFIRSNSQIFLAINGHFHRGNSSFDGEYFLVSQNNAGRVVFEVLADYQDWANGGSGYLRAITLDERNNLITFQTFSTTLSLYQTDANSQFSFPLDFAARFDGAHTSQQTTILQQGVSGYTGSLDTSIWQHQPTTLRGNEVSLSIDGTESGANSQTNGLLRFDNALAQVSADSDILLAKLRVWVDDTGSGLQLHPMLANWDESSTWNTLVGGVSTDGVEAIAAPESFVGGNNANGNIAKGWQEFDVTRTLRANFNGASNFGWVMKPFVAGSNGIDFRSSEAVDPAFRPQLIITTPTEPVTLFSFRQGVAGYSGSVDSQLSQANPDVSGSAVSSMTIDADDPNGSTSDAQVLIKFANIFGSGPGQVPLDGAVTSAMLVLNVSDAGSGFNMHRMLTDWNTTSTWNSLQGGVQTNDAEAAIFADQTWGIDAAGASVAQGQLMLDVTRSVQEWYESGGSTNYGWVLRPWANGNDGVDISSSEATETLRPRLIIRLAGGSLPLCPWTADSCAADFNNDDSIDGDDVIAFFAEWDSSLPCADTTGDGGVDGDDVVTFFNAWDASGVGFPGC